eukprot:TRINITY_DN93186_c0_g1_i1.p1 TRINITY_DN93186_c0_g1~~TRINITY_DN93186_c0_g1_i1.p1  ORF type:complete len:588 (+),score=142.09 TRINITY_DN93186_c0_g1_i1:67-1830(+)
MGGGKAGKGQYGAPVAYGKGKPAYAPPSRYEAPPSYGYKGAQDAWQAPQGDGGSPQVLNLQLSQESQLTSQGFPAEAPALTYEKAMTVFSSGHSILQELVGDIGAEVEIHHDTEWDTFPEVGEAIKAAGGEESCFSVATCPNQGKWAVGIAAGWKGREVSGKLALAVAILAERGVPELEAMCRSYPELREVLVDMGLLRPRGGKRPAGGGYAPPAGKGQSWQAAPQQSWQAGPPQGLPEFVIASLGPDARLVQEGMPSEGPCLYYDKQLSEIFRNGNYFLQEVLGDSLDGQVAIVHDPDWEEMPEIGEAIKQAGGEENCYAVATLPSQGIWGVGVAGGWKPRESAAKLALSVALAASSGETRHIARKYPDLMALFNAAGGGGSAQPAQKKRKFADTPPPREQAFPSPGKGTNGKGTWTKGDKGGKGGKGKAKSKGLPRDNPLWIQLPADQLAPTVLAEMGPDAVVVATDSQGKGVELYECLDTVLEQLVADPTEIEYFDDASWTMFPEIGQAIKQHTDMEEAMQLATCSSLGAWGVGVGHAKSSRAAAAKLALASMITLRAAETGEVPDLSSFPEFSEFVGSVQPPA